MKSIDEFIASIDDTIEQVQAKKTAAEGVVAEALLEVAVTDLVTPMKYAVPVDTGQLRNSIHASRTGNSVEVTASAGHAEYIEYGTGALGDPSVPHTSKNQWTYYSERLGRYVTTSGRQARPFFWPAVAKFESRAESRISQAVERRLDRK